MADLSHRKWPQDLGFRPWLRHQVWLILAIAVVAVLIAAMLAATAGWLVAGAVYGGFSVLMVARFYVRDRRIYRELGFPLRPSGGSALGALKNDSEHESDDA